MSALADALRALMPFASIPESGHEAVVRYSILAARDVLRKHASCAACNGSGWTPASVEAAIAREEEHAINEIANHSFPWCRARLFHALAGAYEQGKLREVLDEIDLPDTEQDHFEDVLVKLGWVRERQSR